MRFERFGSKCERLGSRRMGVYLVFLFTVFMLVAFSHTAQADTSGDYQYTITDDQATITLYVGAGGDVVVPDTLDGYPVIAFGKRAFSNCTSLVSLMIPDSITSIGDYVFNNCSSLTAVNVDTANPDYMDIDGVLFDKRGPKLVCYPMGKTDATYVIPVDITEICNGAFSGCSSLTGITIPNGVTRIGKSAFDNCRKLTEVTLPDSLNSIEDGVFFDCRALTSITIPDGVTSIGMSAFSNCYSLSSITIPSSVDSIKYKAFSYCISLSSIDMQYGITTIDWLAFNNCRLLENVIIPDSVTSIGVSAFSQCSKLSSVSLPNGLTTLNYGVFKDCYALENITIPDSVTSIGDSVFTYCVALKNITIPDSVTSIGSTAFLKCDSLTEIAIPDSVTSIGPYAFSYCFSLTDITFLGQTPPTTGNGWINNTNQGLRGHAYSNSSFPAPGESFNGLTMGDYFYYYYTISNGQATITGYLNRVSIDVTIPATLGGCPVTAIGDSAFRRLPLTSVIIPDSVTSIGNNAFWGCAAMTDVTIPGSVRSIGNDAFSSCTSLRSVTLSSGVESIGNAAFMQCSSLTGLTIPDSVISIGDAAFQGCFSLTDITIPYSVTGIGKAAFLLCSSLNTINIDTDNPSYSSIEGVMFDKTGTTLIQYPVGKPGTSYTIPADVTRIGSSAFYSCPFLTSVTIPDTVTSIGDGAFYRCGSLTSVTIPGGVSSIGNSVFEKCSSLEIVTILNGVTSIGDSMFAFCSALNALTIPESVTSIMDGAFYDCFSLTGVTMPGSVNSIGNYAFEGCTSLACITISGSVTSIGGSAFARCSSLTDITFLSLTPPTLEDSSSWIAETHSDLQGHAYFGTGFPAPAGYFNGLIMGDYIAPPITEVSPHSPIILYTQGTETTQTFAALYENHGLVSSATLVVDTAAPMALGTTGFSDTISLALGSHTIILTIKDEAGNEAIQTWDVTVIQDIMAPIISGITDKQKVTFGSLVTVCITDDLSGVNMESLKVYIGNKDVTSDITLTANGFTLSSTELGKGEHAIKISVSDNVGNTATAKCDIKVK